MRPRTYPVRCRDGTEKIIHFRPVQLEDGCHLMTCEDITGGIEKEQALQEREQRFRTVFQKGPLGMALLGLDLTWIAFNDRYAEMVGFTVDELKRVSVLELTHPEDLNDSMDYFLKLRRGEAETCNYQKRHVKKNGEIIWVDVTDSIIRDDSGDGLYYLGMVEDITDKKLRDGPDRRVPEGERGFVKRNSSPGQKQPAGHIQPLSASIVGTPGMSASMRSSKRVRAE